MTLRCCTRFSYCLAVAACLQALGLAGSTIPRRQWHDAPDPSPKPTTATCRPGAPHETPPLLPHIPSDRNSRLDRATSIPNQASGDSIPAVVRRDKFTSVQVNVDEFGRNIPGDAANEPSIAQSVVDPDRFVIGWRQFDSVKSDFREAGWAYSHDGGESWKFRGVLEENAFRSDPVLMAGANGEFLYLSLTGSFKCDLFRSLDSGMSWQKPVPVPAGDKPWMTTDLSPGPGRGHIYAASDERLMRSVDGGLTFEPKVTARMFRGTLTAATDGRVYVVAPGSIITVSRSDDARFADQAPSFQIVGQFKFPIVWGHGELPTGGLAWQPWIDVDRSDGPISGRVYVLGCGPYTDFMYGTVYITHSDDLGVTWSEPRPVNTDLDHPTKKWFPTLAVAPGGRLDVTWNDPRDDPALKSSEVFYTYSVDGGETWSLPIPVTPPFDPHLGMPSNQDKLGDYYHLISDDAAAYLAYSATFNGEQDVYFLRIPYNDCNSNGVFDDQDIAEGTSQDCNGNGVPDECEQDCNGNGRADECDITDGTLRDDDGDGRPDECLRIVYVDDDATGANDGTSWPNAFADLAEALRLVDQLGADALIEVHVAQGAYRPGTPGASRQSTFNMPPGATLLGGYRGGADHGDDRDPRLYPTILSGDLNGDDAPGFGNRADNACHVVVLHSAPSRTVRLDGLEISGGQADDLTPSGGGILASGDLRLTDVRLVDNFAVHNGAAIKVTMGAVDMQHCLVQSNRVGTKGGIALSAGTLRMSDSTLQFNEALHDGAGIFVASGAVEIRRCVLASNRDGIIESKSGTLLLEDSVFTANEGVGACVLTKARTLVTRCLFAANRSVGIYAQGPVLTIEDSTFEDNERTSVVAGARKNLLKDCTFLNNSNLEGGGGALSVKEDVNLLRCVFWGNRSAYDGGAIIGESLHAQNCIFAANRSNRYGGGAIYAQGDVEITQCLLWKNEANGVGGAINARDCSLVLRDSLVAYNHATGLGGGIIGGNQNSVVISNSILWANEDVYGLTERSQLYMFNDDLAHLVACCYDRWANRYGGKGNFGDDPLFTDIDGADNVFPSLDDDFTLEIGSRCIDAGRNPIVPRDDYDLDDDGVFGEPLPLDFAGLPRFHDVAGVDDHGVGAPPIIDIGPFENQHP